MSISFSGLASGLDTSSWVESLVALKQAKIDTLEEQKETVLLSRETLNNIKSFFNSFRSVIEKVTDAKYGVVSMDIFAQKLATSSNLNVLTASATTEAQEATYTVLVDNLATSTEALSGLNSFTTIIQTETATADTRLLDLGVKVGNIGVTNNKGVYNILGIEENDTISSFITKLREIGVDASYNQRTGIFGINLDDDSIDDTLTVNKDGSVGTGIKDILHLQEKGGYESTFLQLTTSETIVSQATGSTKLSELGNISAGNIQVKANGNTYTIGINGNTTIDAFIKSLRDKGIDAEFKDGSIIINDAEIIDSGNTGLLENLGLESEVNSQTQITGKLTTIAIETTIVAATGATKLSELGKITNGNLKVKANGTTYDIAVTGNTTLSQLVTALTGKGVSAILTNDGTLTISDAELVDNGTGVIAALGLEMDVISKSQSSVDLKQVVKTTTVTSATGATKLSELGTITNGNLQVKINGSPQNIAVTGNTTLSQLVTALTGKGVNASLSSDGTFTVKDAELVDNGTGVIAALGLERSVASHTQSSGNLSSKSVVTTQVNATGGTKVSAIDGWSTLGANPTMVMTNAAGAKSTTTVTATMTLNDVISKLNAAGISAALNDGVLSVSGGEITGNAAVFLGIASGSQNTNQIMAVGNVLYNNSTSFASESDTLGGLGISTTKPSGGYALAVFNSSNTLVKEIAVSSNTKIEDVFKSLGSYGIVGTIEDGKVTLVSNNGNYIKGVVADGLGISTRTTVNVSSTTATSSSTLKYIETIFANETVSFAQVGIDAAGKVLEIQSRENASVVGSFTVASNAQTFGDLFSALDKYGITAFIDDGVITFSSVDYVVGGTMASLLGIKTISTGDAFTVGEQATSNPYYYSVVTAGVDSKISRFITLDSNPANNVIRIYSTLGASYTDFTIRESTTFNQLISALSAKGISASLTNGVFKITQVAYGVYAEDVGSGRFLNKLGISNAAYTIRTGITQTGTVTVPTSKPNFTFGVSLTDIITGFEPISFTFTVTSTTTHGIYRTYTVSMTSTASSYNLYGDGNEYLISGHSQSGVEIKLKTYNIGSKSNKIFIRLEKMGYSGIDNALQELETLYGFERSTYSYSLNYSDGTSPYYTGIQYGISLDALTLYGVKQNEELYKYEKINAKTGAIETITVKATSSMSINDNIGELFKVVNNKLTQTKTKDSDYVYNIISMGDNFKNAFGLKGAGEGVSYTTKSTKRVSGSSQKLQANEKWYGFSDSTKLSQLGLTSNGTIIINNTEGGRAPIIVDSNLTVKQFKDLMVSKGITCNFTSSSNSTAVTSSNTLTLGSLNGSTWIESMSQNLKDALKVSVGSGKSYLLVGNAGLENSSSRLLRSVATHQVTGTTRFEELNGYSAGNGNIAVHKADGTFETIYVSGSSTIQDFLSQIAEYGLSGSINSSGIITIKGTGDTYLANAAGGSNILSLMKLVLTKTSKSSIVNTCGNNVLNSTAKAAATLASPLEKLIYSNGTKVTFDSNGLAALALQIKTREGITNNYTINFSRTQTLEDVFSTLREYGLSASIDGSGKMSLSSTSLADFTVGGTLGNYLMGANCKKTYQTTSCSTLISKTTTTSTVAVTRDTKLSELGITGGEYYIYNNGVKYTAIASADDTLGSFIDNLKSFGIQAGLVGSGSASKLVIQGSGDSYIAKSTNTSNVSNIVDKLASSGLSSTYSYSGNKQKTVSATTTVAATGDTALSSFDVTVGAYDIFQDGVKYTEYISADDTLETFMNKLQAHGIQATLVNQGGSAKLMLQGSGNSYVAKSSNVSNTSNVVEKLFGTTSTVNKMSYTGKEEISRVTTSTVAATADTALSAFGVTSGEYYIYKDGVKYTALISSDETLGSFMETLKSFGFQTALVKDGNASKLVVIGSGDSYITKSNNAANVSNIMDILYTIGNAGAAGGGAVSGGAGSTPNTTYTYGGAQNIYTTVTHTTTATEDTLLSAFDTPWGGTMLKASGKLALSVDGKNRVIQITETETFRSLIDKLDSIGVEAQLIGGKFYISEMNNVSIITSQTTSSLINPNASIKLAYKNSMDMFMESTAPIEKTTTIIEEATLSASNYADLNTKLSTLNITGGTFSVFRNGQKATININSESTFSDLRSQISSKFSDIDLKFEDGKLVIFSKTSGVEVKAGSTTDTSNLLSITGLAMNEEGQAVSARQLYSVNENSVLTQTGLFRKADIKAGTFTVGEQVINITDKSTLYDVITQINSSDKSNATAYWDSINGRFVIKSRTTGSALINIEAGTSNFTDVMGYTETEWYSDGSVKMSKMNTELQKIGSNAHFSINGTQFSATSNTITSDISRIKGLTLNLTGLTNGSSVTVKVEKDKETVANSLSEVVDSYNELMKNVDEAVARSGALHNQSMLKMLRNQIRNAMMTSIGGDSVFKNLHSIGISVSSANANNISTSNESIINLSFDKEKFLKAYEADSAAVKELLIGRGIKGAAGSTDGVFTKVEGIVENALTSVIGYFSIADEAYGREIKKIDNKIVKGTEAIEKYRARLNKKFNSMDMLISNMQNQYSSFLGAG